MNTTIRKLSIFVFMVPAMTTLMIGPATTFAASNTHQQMQQIGNDDSWTSSFTHSPYSTGTVGSDDLGYSQYGSGNHSVEPGSFSSIEYGITHTTATTTTTTTTIA
jgi:hypothetical protein